ncbi:MAG: hypothetical protein PVI19_12740 [Syntrophobacterales bacterium]|jgi:hypothetical protein
MAELSENQIEKLLQDYLAKMLEEDKRNRNQGENSWTNLDDHADATAHLQHDCYRELAIGNFSRVLGAVDRLIRQEGIELKRDGISYEKLCREMLKVMINYLEIDIRRTRLDYSTDDLPFPEFLPAEEMGKAPPHEARENQAG